MRKAIVHYKDQVAGTLIQNDEGRFRFTYIDAWYENPDKPAISLSLPKVKREYNSAHLFSCFYNMLPEGMNKAELCALMTVEPDDHFGLLMHSAQFDSIGALTIKNKDFDETR